MMRSCVCGWLVGIACAAGAVEVTPSYGQTMADRASSMKTITARQHEWLSASPRGRMKLAETIGENGMRAMAKSKGYEPICDGLDRVLPQGLDGVYGALTDGYS